MFGIMSHPDAVRTSSLTLKQTFLSQEKFEIDTIAAWLSDPTHGTSTKVATVKTLMPILKFSNMCTQHLCGFFCFSQKQSNKFSFIFRKQKCPQTILSNWIVTSM